MYLKKAAVKPVHFRRDEEQVLGGCEKITVSRRLCEGRGEGKVKRAWKKVQGNAPIISLDPALQLSKLLMHIAPLFSHVLLSLHP